MVCRVLEPTCRQRGLCKELDIQLRQLNVYYDDLISGNILRTLKLTGLRKNAFIEYMRSIGKLGGQNKVPRLSNDRKIATALQPFIDQADIPYPPETTTF